MTRSFVALTHGDWREAIQWHPMGPVLALWFLVIFIVVPVEAARGKPMVSGRRWFQNVFVSVVLLCVLGGIVRGFWE